MTFPVGNTFLYLRRIGKRLLDVVDVRHQDAAEQDWPPASTIFERELVGLAGALAEVDPAAVERARGRPRAIYAEAELC